MQVISQMNLKEKKLLMQICGGEYKPSTGENIVEFSALILGFLTPFKSNAKNEQTQNQLNKLGSNIGRYIE